MPNVDKFGVPKKVNRHVLKAIYLMNERGCKATKHTDIMKLVKTTMKGPIPNDLSTTVLKSLKNMAKLGIIRKWGKNFAVYDKNDNSLEKGVDTSIKNDKKENESNNERQHYSDEDVQMDDATCSSDHENTKKTQSNEASSVKESKDETPEKQSHTTSQYSVRKVYKSDHFSKDSNEEIDSNQKKNESGEPSSVAKVAEPSSEETVCSLHDDVLSNETISSKLVISFDRA